MYIIIGHHHHRTQHTVTPRTIVVVVIIIIKLMRHEIHAYILIIKLDVIFRIKLKSCHVLRAIRHMVLQLTRWCLLGYACKRHGLSCRGESQEDVLYSKFGAYCGDPLDLQKTVKIANLLEMRYKFVRDTQLWF